ncbi:HupE/UreJ family protein [Bermanella marisrubri]|nr:HupE/UreJ family protein [Bermanella marisrubri]
MKKLLLISLSLFAVSNAFAHPGHESISASQGLLAGVLHPLMGLDHLLALIAVGVVAGLAGKRTSWSLPVCYAVIMLIGFVIAAMGVTVFSMPVVETLILSSVVLGAALILVGRRGNAYAKSGLLLGFALFHGIAHGIEVPAHVSANFFASGFVMASLAIMLLASIVVRYAPTLRRNGESQPNA